MQALFAAVAPTYDLLNTLLSFGRHKRWRAIATREARLQAGDRALDVCTGTGDFAVQLRGVVGPAGLVAGVDFCGPMVRLGVRKARRQGQAVAFALGDALALPYPDATFDAATVGFGIRNVADVPAAFREMARVVRPGGRVVCLELARPTHPLFSALYYLYFERILPRIGRLVHGKLENYAYLPASLARFSNRDQLRAQMEQAGIEDVMIRDLTFGIVAIHSGTRALASCTPAPADEALDSCKPDAHSASAGSPDPRRSPVVAATPGPETDPTASRRPR